MLICALLALVGDKNSLVCGFLKRFGCCAHSQIIPKFSGPSGVQAAYSAEEAGLTVALFEKDSFVGGKTKLIEVDGRTYPLGAVVHDNARTYSLLDLLKKFNTTSIVVDEVKEQVISNGSYEELPGMGIWSILSWARFIFFHKLFFHAKIDGPEGYLQYEGASSYENFQPINDWLAKRWLKSGMLPIIWNLMTGFGYGSPSEVPVLYWFKYADKGTLFSRVVREIPLFWQGGSRSQKFEIQLFEELLLSMADSLNGQVYLSAVIKEVDYGQSETKISFAINESDTQQLSCGSTIIAFPPLQGSIEVFAPPEASQALLSLSSQVTTSNYYVALIKNPDNFFEQTIYFTPVRDEVQDNPAQIILLFKMYKENESLVNAFYLSPSSKTDEEAKQEIIMSYSKLTSKQIDQSDIVVYQPWLNYFPIAPTDALRDGFFQKFDDLEGVSRQYYTGGLFNFETVQNSMEHAHFIIEKYLA